MLLNVREVNEALSSGALTSQPLENISFAHNHEGTFTDGTLATRSLFYL